MSETFHIRDERKPGHFWADNEIYDVFAARIGVYAFAVYMALCKYVNKQAACNPSYEEVARKLGISRRQVIRAIETLKDYKLIKVRQTYTTVEGKRRFSSNSYTLLDVKSRTDLGNLVTDSHQGSDCDALPSDCDAPDLVTDSHLNKTHEQYPKNKGAQARVSSLDELKGQPNVSIVPDIPQSVTATRTLTPQEAAGMNNPVKLNAADEALLRHSKGNKKTSANEWETHPMAENVRARGRAFMQAANVQPTKKKITDWIASLEESYQYCPDDAKYLDALPDVVLFARLSYGTCARPGTLATPLTDYIGNTPIFKANLNKLVKDMQKQGVPVGNNVNAVQHEERNGEHVYRI